MKRGVYKLTKTTIKKIYNMMRNLLYTLLFLASAGVSAQLTVPDDLGITGDAETIDVALHYDLELIGQDSVWVHWEILLSDETPQEWSTYLCDNILCYFEGVRKCPTGAFKINRFYENTPQEWIFHTEPNGVEGQGTVTMNTYYLDYNTANHTPFDFSDVEYDGDTLSMSSHSFTVTVGDQVAVQDIDLATVKIFPNPTTDIFQVKSDEYVKTIGVYNVVGKLVEEMDHTMGQTHNIEHLNKGMYLVRLISEGGQVIKTMKLSKR